MISNFWWTNFKKYIIMKHRVMIVAGWDQSGGSDRSRNEIITEELQWQKEVDSQVVCREI